MIGKRPTRSVRRQTGRAFRLLSTAAVVLTTATLVGPNLGHASGGAQEATTGEAMTDFARFEPLLLAQAADTFAFAIPPQPLGDALDAFVRITGWQVGYSAELARDRRSADVEGNLTPSEALTQLLAGSGLDYRLTATETVTLERAVVQPDSGPILLAPLVVQGQLQIRTIQESPTSVAIQTGEELERRGDFNLYDAIQRIPNVSLGGQERRVVIRGIDQAGPGGPGGGGNLVSTQVDGVALTDRGITGGGPFNSWDLQQVEVLRGPQSTQQGRNALAGAIVLRSNDPTYDLELRSRGEVGSRATLGGAVMANVPLVEDRLAVRFSADRLQTDGFVENPTRNEDDFDAREQTNLRGKLRLDPTDDLEIIASFSQTDNSRGSNFIEEAFFPDDRFNFSDVNIDEDSLHRNSGLRLTWRIDEAFSLESETNYYTLDYERLTDRNRPAADDLGFLDTTSDDTVFEQDLRLRYEGDDLTGVFGLFFTEIEEDELNITRDPASLINPSAPPGVFVMAETRSLIERQNFGVFAEAELGADWLLPGLSLTFGARYDRETVEADARIVAALDPAGPSPFPLPDDRTQNEETFSAFLPKVGVTYDWTPDVATSFTVQRGYRAGGTQVNIVTQQVNEFDPEFTWNYEFALRSQFFDRRLTANANLFYTDWRNQQVSVENPLDGNDFNVVNAGESRLYGAEASLEALVTPNLDVFGSIGLVRTEFLEFEDAGRDFSGNEFRLAPEVTLAFGATYFFDNGLSIGADASYTGGSFSDADNDPREESDARFLVNTQVTYEQDRWNAGFFVRNLFDNDYATQRFVQQQDGTRTLITGEPRTFGLYVGFEF